MAIIPALMLISSFTKSQAEGAKYATIRTVEAALGGSRIVLCYEGKTEELDLDKGTTGNMVPNTLKINAAINLMASKGYELVSQSGGDYISMYSFVKK